MAPVTGQVRWLDREAPSRFERSWDELVASCPESGFMQSSAWADFRRGQGYGVVHAGLFEGDRLVGGAIAYGPPAPAVGGLWVLPEGPVLPWSEERLAASGMAALLEAFTTRACDEGIVGLRIEPRLGLPKPSSLRNFRRSPLDLLPPETLCLNLAASDEALLAQMKPKGRYNIRLAERHGVTVRVERTAAAMVELVRVLEEAARRDHFFLEPSSFFHGLAEALMPPGLAQVLLAAREGEVLGAMLLVTFGRRATYLYGGVSNRERHRMAGYALQWAAMRAARAAGCTQYDFYGYEPFGRSEHLYAGFSRFKRQFGGEATRFIGAHEAYFLDPLADAVVRALQEIGA